MYLHGTNSEESDKSTYESAGQFSYSVSFNNTVCVIALINQDDLFVYKHVKAISRTFV